MRNKIFLTVLCYLLVVSWPLGMLAKNYNVSQLPIVTRIVPEWSMEYPTVINNWDGMFINSVQGELPPVLSVVTSINGRDTRGMDEATLNDLLMSQNTSTLDYLVKKEGTDVKKHCTISYYNNIYWAEGVIMNDPDDFPQNIKTKNIKNASVFSFNTFAFKTGNTTEVDELSVLKAAGKSLEKLGFKNVDNVNNADMVLVLTIGRDEYNGYKITLDIFDGEKLSNGTERILWSLQISDLAKDLKRQEGIIKTAMNQQCNNFPFDIPIYCQSINTLGIAFESEQAVSSGKTLKILKGSDAYDKGLRSGDQIVSAYAGYSMDHILLTRTRRYYFKAGKRERQKNWGVDFLFILPIIPQFTFNNANHYLTDGTWRGGNSSKNHFRIRNSYGKKFTVYAPFEKKRFNLKYIR